MTSSMQDLASHSVQDGSDEQQKQMENQTQYQRSAMMLTIPGMPSSPAEFTSPRVPIEQGHPMAQTVYPYPDPYYHGVFAAYGGQPMIHSHLMGVHQTGVPLPSDAVEEPVYVNAKQYHGILRRRQSRAKAESENKLIKCRKPYLHESRHQHALRRARGCGGRFLNAKTEEKQEKKSSEINRNSQFDRTSINNQNSSLETSS